MPARTCPDCGRRHNHTSHKCTGCYERIRSSGKRTYTRPYAPPPCGDDICGQPATETRRITVGLPGHTITQDHAWLFLCPSCAILFDQDEKEHRTNYTVIIPTHRTAISGRTNY